NCLELVLVRSALREQVVDSSRDRGRDLVVARSRGGAVDELLCMREPALPARGHRWHVLGDRADMFDVPAVLLEAVEPKALIPCSLLQDPCDVEEQERRPQRPGTRAIVL